MDLRDEVGALDDTILALGTTISAAQELYDIVPQPEEPTVTAAGADCASILGEAGNFDDFYDDGVATESGPSLGDRGVQGFDAGRENPMRGVGAQARSSKAQEPGTHVRSGMLWKKGLGSRKPFGRKNWKCRYFVLGPGDGADATMPRLRYLASEAGRKVLGEVQLARCTLQADVSHKKHEHYFELEEADAGRRWHFYASSAEERGAWLTAIAGAIKQLDAVSDADTGSIGDGETDAEANN